MKKMVALLALVGGMSAAPVVPVQAGPMLSDDQANCLILPALKKECWQKGAEMAAEMKVPFVLWHCKPAEKGSGHLLDC